MDTEVTSTCVTLGGNIVGHRCKFPFVYNRWNDYPYVPASFIRWFPNEIKFESCTNFRNNGKLWCVTKVTSDNRYIPGHWGECPETTICGAVKRKYTLLFAIAYHNSDTASYKCFNISEEMYLRRIANIGGRWLLENQKVFSVLDGDDLELECIATGAKPPPRLKWFMTKTDSFVQEISNGHIKEDRRASTNYRIWTTISHLIFPISKDDNNTNIKCLAEHPSLNEVLATEISLFMVPTQFEK